MESPIRTTRILSQFCESRREKAARANADDLGRSRCALIMMAVLVQEVLPIQRVTLGGAEAGVADNAAQFFFGGAVGYAGGADYIFF